MKPKLNYQNLLEVTIFNILFFFFLSPTVDLIAAPLHDPSITSVFASKVLRADFVKEAILGGEYPPYLHLTAALLSKITGIITSQIILFLTNFSVILTGLGFGIFWKKVFKNNYAFPISVLLIMFTCPSIPNFYFASGKNAMVVSFFFWFVCFYLSKDIFSVKKETKFLKGLVSVSYTHLTLPTTPYV